MRRKGVLPAPRDLVDERGRKTRSRPTASANVRSAAAWIVERSLAARSPVDLFLADTEERFDERDQALLRELVFGTLRWLRRLDQILAAASHRPLAEIEPALLPVLRVAVYQLLWLDRVPAHAAVDEAVEDAARKVHRGAASFANAVLRRIARGRGLDDWPIDESDPVRRLAIESSHPDRMVERWWRRFGEERTREVVAANNRPRVLQVLAFRDRGGREALAERLIEEGCEVAPSPLSPLGLTILEGRPFATRAFAAGELYVQDEASQLAAWLPPPEPDERIWDVAAAPGGKTFATLAREPAARVFASDASLARLATLRENSHRLGRVVPTFVGDGMRPPVVEGFDRVVLDLPCSGTGTLRKHPELKWRWSESEIARLADQATRLLVGAADAVRVGGLLVAITCSIEWEENEEIGRRFLALREEFRRVDLSPWTISGAELEEGVWRMLPGGEHDGFSVQAFRREARGFSGADVRGSLY